MGTALKVVAELEDRQKQAVELDAEIRKLMTSAFVEVGLRLIDMRDTELYKDLPGHAYAKFEDYVVSVEGITKRHARRIICAAIVCRDLPNGGGDHVVPPSTESHARYLVSEADFKYEDRGDVRVPVSLRDPNVVAKRWGRVLSKNEQRIKKFKKDNPGKEPKPMSAMFVAQVAQAQTVSVEKSDNSKSGQLGRATKKLTNLIDELTDDSGRLKVIAEKEGWTRELRTSLKGQLKDARIAIDTIEGALSKLRLKD